MPLEILNWVGLELAGGRYLVQGRLGEGGMGFVYKARDHNLDCDVVLKVPRPGMLEEGDFAARFAREIRSLVKLSHPHIVKVTDVGTYEGIPYAVLQYLSGGTLRDRQPTDDEGNHLPLTLAAMAEWLRPIAEALDFIHQQGYIHRDVKPDNILFDAHGHAYLTDFGVAKVLAEGEERRSRTVKTARGLVLGTPQYMAPELIMGEKYDGRIDQYALGVMVYELLTCRFPFDGPTAPAIFVQHTTQEAPPLTEILSGIPASTATVVQRTLKKDPTQRFSSCTEFVEALLATRKAEAPPSRGRTAPNKRVGDAGQLRVIRCPKCGKELRVRQTAAGKRLRCPMCNMVFSSPVVAVTQTEEIEPRAPGGRSDERNAPTAPLPPTPKPPPLPGKARPPQIPTRSRIHPALWTVGALAFGIVLGLIVLLVVSNPEPERPQKRRVAEAVPDVQAGAPQLPPAAPAPVPGEEPYKEIRVLDGHQGLAWCVAFSPDGRSILSGGSDHKVFLWDAEAGKLIRSIGTHSSGITSVCFLPDSQRCATGTGGGSLRIWNVETGEEGRQLGGHLSQIEALVALPDGRTLLSGGLDRIARTWDVYTGKELRHSRDFGLNIWGAAYLPRENSVLLALGSLTRQERDVTLWSWDLNDDTTRPLSGYRGSLRTLAISSDGTRGATGSVDGTMAVLDLPERKIIGQLSGLDKNIYALGFLSGNSRVLAGGSDGQMRLWDVKDGRELHRFPDHPGNIWKLAVSPDGRRAVTACNDGRLRIWSLPQ